MPQDLVDETGMWNLGHPLALPILAMFAGGHLYHRVELKHRKHPLPPPGVVVSMEQKRKDAAAGGTWIGRRQAWSTITVDVLNRLLHEPVEDLREAMQLERGIRFLLVRIVEGFQDGPCTGVKEHLLPLPCLRHLLLLLLPVHLPQLLEPQKRKGGVDVLVDIHQRGDDEPTAVLSRRVDDSRQESAVDGWTRRAHATHF